MAANTTKTILNGSEDWEKWLSELRGTVNNEIWPFIDLEDEERALKQLSDYPEYADLDRNATSYATLSVVHQRAFDNARRYYDQDMRYYSRQ